MVMQRWDPFREMRRMEDTIEQMRRRFGSQGVDSSGPEAWVAPLDIIQEGDNIVLHASLPGVNPDQINVTYEDGVLTIEGRTENSFEHQEGNYLMRERHAGRFHRSVRLPDVVDVDKAETSYQSGVLTVTLPKAEEKRARKLDVQVKEPQKTIAG